MCENYMPIQKLCLSVDRKRKAEEEAEQKEKEEMEKEWNKNFEVFCYLVLK